jgi:hypothetical protein
MSLTWDVEWQKYAGCILVPGKITQLSGPRNVEQKLPETKKYKIISFTNINPWPISNTHRKKKPVFSWLDQHSSLFGGQKETIFQII